MRRIGLILAVVLSLGGCAAGTRPEVSSSTAPSSPGQGALTTSPGPSALPSPVVSPAPASADAPSVMPSEPPSPAAASQVPSLAPPASPTSASIVIDSAGFGGIATLTATWKQATSDGVTMRIYGVTKCLNAREPGPGETSVPCLVPGTQLTADVERLVATAPAADGRVTWSWPGWGDIGAALGTYNGEDFYAFVIGGNNAAGNSPLYIMATSAYCPTCTT
jgi:hypothetical protein